MLISCTWLNELLEGAPIRIESLDDRAALGPTWIAAKLTALGLEVEGIRFFDLPGVVVGEVREVVDHPKSDRLHVVQLFDGGSTVQVVCGANNLPPAGGKVAFAPVGTTLPGGLTLAARDLRGVESQGMICSEDEIDLGSDHDGIVILPSDWPAGTLLTDLVPGLRDCVIEIAVTPNRPDALGHVGVAIDLAVALGVGLRSPATFDPAILPDDAGLVTVPADDRCGRYLGFALDAVRVGRSPLWMRTRLHRAGLRAINDVVDITNFVLMETGQPIHAFDRAKLAEGRVVIRTATAGERLATLDGKTIELGPDDLTIADANRPAALAGVMGGGETGVDATTTSLLLEVAWFEPRGVRRSARRHGFHTDASHRFERGVDHGGKLELAAKRALQLLVQLTGARPTLKAEALGIRPASVEILLRPERIHELLGMPIGHEEAARILAGLRVEVDRTRPVWSCKPPSFRPDLRREVDLIEEVMRHHGLADLPAHHSVHASIEPIPEDPRRRLADAVTDSLRGRGLAEHVGLAFTSDEALTAFSDETPVDRRVRLSNALRHQYAVLRTHLLPGLLDAVEVNHARHDRPIGLFEVGRIYRWPEHPTAVASGVTSRVDAQLPEEPRRVGIMRAARRSSGAPTAELVRAVGQTLLSTLESLDLWAVLGPLPHPVGWLHPGVQAGVWIPSLAGGLQVGRVGEVHPDIAHARNLSELELAYGELWLEDLVQPREFGYRELARFPASARDLSLDLAVEVAAGIVVQTLLETGRELASDDHVDPVRLDSSADRRIPIELLEDWRGQGVAEGRRALLVRMHYRARERSVTDAEVQALHDAIVGRVCRSLEQLDPAVRIR